MSTSNRSADHLPYLLSQDSRGPANPHTIIRVRELQFPSRSSRRKLSGITYTETPSGTCPTPAPTAILPGGPLTSKLFPSTPTSRLRTQSATTTPSSPLSHIPERTEDIIIDETRCDDLPATESSISDHIRLRHRTRKQACNLPILNLSGSGCHHICETGTERAY
ncbi:hypothetical protein HOY80DRAFT_1020918 [Tuber brumale]|nr:hypothetical protein HOY80DRAFT_1020918 [Tuber brumale]